MQKDYAIVRMVLTQSQAGVQRHRSRQKQNYLTSQRNLRRAAEDFRRGRYANNMELYLERISHAIRF